MKKDETKIKKKLGLVHSGSITVRLVSSFTNLDTTASLHPNNNIRSLVVKSSLVKLETNCTLILPPPLPIASVICSGTYLYSTGIQTHDLSVRSFLHRHFTIMRVNFSFLHFTFFCYDELFLSLSLSLSLSRPLSNDHPFASMSVNWPLVS